MFYKEMKLDDIVDEMRNVGDVLIEHTFPKAPPPGLEDELAAFRQREAVIDGYPVIIHYQKSDYDEYFLETLQIYGERSPFIPFSVICKLGKRFLGSHHLSLVELFKGNRKVYVWSVCVDRDGKPIPSPYDTETEECLFEGFHYSYMQPSQVNFF